VCSGRGVEACASAHYWARELTGLGHIVRLMPAAYVKPYAKRGKSDAIDAVMQHRTRNLLVRQRTMLANALRGHLAEFGIVGASGLWKLEQRVAMGPPWVAALLARRPADAGVTVAVANKLARIAWAVPSRGESFGRNLPTAA
jgi:transposase